MATALPSAAEAVFAMTRTVTGAEQFLTMSQTCRHIGRSAGTVSLRFQRMPKVLRCDTSGDQSHTGSHPAAMRPH
jgi:hypothetical protein